MDFLYSEIPPSVFREHVEPYLGFQPTKTARIIQEAITSAIISKIQQLGVHNMQLENLWRFTPPYAYLPLKAFIEGESMDFDMHTPKKLQGIVEFCVLSTMSEFMELCRYRNQQVDDDDRYWEEAYEDYFRVYASS